MCRIRTVELENLKKYTPCTNITSEEKSLKEKMLKKPIETEKISRQKINRLKRILNLINSRTNSSHRNRFTPIINFIRKYWVHISIAAALTYTLAPYVQVYLEGGTISLVTESFKNMITNVGLFWKSGDLVMSRLLLYIINFITYYIIRTSMIFIQYAFNLDQELPKWKKILYSVGIYSTQFIINMLDFYSILLTFAGISHTFIVPLISWTFPHQMPNIGFYPILPTKGGFLNKIINMGNSLRQWFNIGRNPKLSTEGGISNNIIDMGNNLGQWFNFGLDVFSFGHMGLDEMTWLNPQNNDISFIYKVIYYMFLPLGFFTSKAVNIVKMTYSRIKQLIILYTISKILIGGFNISGIGANIVSSAKRIELLISQYLERKFRDIDEREERNKQILRNM